MLSLWSDDVTTTVRLWSLADDAVVENGDHDGSLTVMTRWGELEVDGLDTVAAESLRRMGFGPVDLRNAFPAGKGAAATPPKEAVVALERVLDRIGGAVVHSLGLPNGEQPLLSVEPVVAAPVFRPEVWEVHEVARLSRFAVLRPGRGGMVLERPNAGFRVLLRQPLSRAITAELGVAADARRVADGVGAPPELVAEVMSFLHAAGAVVVPAADGRFAEDTDRALRGWAPHELSFQQHSRHRSVQPDDEGDTSLPPVTRPRPDGDVYPLPRPDLDERAATDPSLTALLETDHLCPDLAGARLTVDQVGELLYRSVRIRSTGPAHLPSPGGGPAHEASQRPYANIACLYELEVYLALDNVDGLPAGIYHYEPLEHALTCIDDDPEHVGGLLDIGRFAAGGRRRPPLALTITARIGRLSWILPGSSLSVALTHCGALQQTLYLVAKAMGLWAHAVPADATGVDELLGLEWPAEVGLAECVVDAVPPQPPTR